MSCHERRSEVHEVKTCDSAMVAGIGLAALVVGAAFRALWEASRYIRTQTGSLAPVTKADSVQALSALTAHRKCVEQQVACKLQKLKLPPAEALKVKTLACIQSTPYLVQSPVALKPSLDALCHATTIRQAEAARQKLTEALESGHRHVLEQSITVACEAACSKIGFGTIRTARGPLGTIRVIAENPAGHALVAEITAGDSSRGPRIESEILGVTDGSCMDVMDKFGEALEGAGVRSNPPVRNFTGGVCELDAAREFLRTKLHPSAQASTRGKEEHAAVAAVHRARRLNQPQTTIRIRRK